MVNVRPAVVSANHISDAASLGVTLAMHDRASVMSAQSLGVHPENTDTISIIIGLILDP
jgi:hypothetical protein